MVPIHPIRRDPRNPALSELPLRSQRTLCFERIELLTNDLAELSGGDLRNSEKNDFEIRRSAKRRVDLSRKPGFWIDHQRKHRSTVRHPACVLYRLTSDPGCRTALPTGKETFTMALKTMAAIVVRPRTALWVGATLLAAGALTGCGHSRTSYRPVYTSPATVATPCKNCGPAAAVTTEESDLPPVTSVPSSSEPSMLDSATSSTPSRSGSGTVELAGSSPRRSRDSASPRSTKPARPGTTRPLRRRRRRRPVRAQDRAVQGPTTLLSPSSNWGDESGRPESSRQHQLEPRSARQSERAAQALSG